MQRLAQISFTRSIKTKLVLLGCLIGGILLAGYGYIYHRSNQMFWAELEARGSAIARQFASGVSEYLHAEDPEVLKRLNKKVLQNDDVGYVIITDEHESIIVSSSRFNWQPVVLPEKLRHGTCQGTTPVFRKHIITDEALYDISVPILASIRPAGAEETLLVTPAAACSGSVHLGISLTKINHQLRYLFGGIVAMTIIVLLSGILGLRFISKKLITPILNMIDMAEKISAGELTQTIDVNSADEIGVLEAVLSQIGQSTNTMTEQLTKIYDQIELSSSKLVSLSEVQITSSQQKMSAVFQLSAQAKRTSDTSHRIWTEIEHVAEVAASALQSTQSMEESIRQTLKDMEEMCRQVSNNTERVMLLGEKIVQISHIVKMINTIADHTKLIAFNASIEAAGAGDAGGRFSVVATEVRRLASTVVESVEEIKNSVASIETANNELILFSETGVHKVNQGTRQIAAIRDSLQQMTEMLEETSRSTSTISSSMQQQQSEHELLSHGFKDISNILEQSIETSTHVNELARTFLAQKEDLKRVLPDRKQEETLRLTDEKTSSNVKRET